MSNQKHTVATDALETLGSIIDESAARDAIHLAVEPVKAAFKLYPGQHVGKLPDGDYSADANKKVGIVDPFLTNPVYPGERFWLVVYPRQITSLRHVWTHPAFDDAKPEPPTVADSKKWLEDYAASVPVEYGDLISRAHEFVKYGSYWTEGGRFEGECIPDEFWDHFSNVEGVEKEDDGFNNFFSCSC